MIFAPFDSWLAGRAGTCLGFDRSGLLALGFGLGRRFGLGFCRFAFGRLGHGQSSLSLLEASRKPKVAIVAIPTLACHTSLILIPGRLIGAGASLGSQDRT